MSDKAISFTYKVIIVLWLGTLSYTTNLFRDRQQEINRQQTDLNRSHEQIHRITLSYIGAIETNCINSFKVVAQRLAANGH